MKKLLGNSAIKKLSLAALVLFYISAGINHFIHPEFYIPLIPPYFQYLNEINILSGIAEVSLGLLLIFPKTRKLAALGIVLMLIAFIPSHWYFIEIGSCVQGGLCVSETIGWLRLFIIHPLLIAWPFWHFMQPDLS